MSRNLQALWEEKILKLVYSCVSCKFLLTRKDKTVFQSSDNQEECYTSVLTLVLCREAVALVVLQKKKNACIGITNACLNP